MATKPTRRPAAKKPAPPPPPPKPDIFYVNDFVTYSGKRGQTETKKYTMTSFNGADYTITMLFNMYSAQDRLEVYQSTLSWM